MKIKLDKVTGVVLIVALGLLIAASLQTHELQGHNQTALHYIEKGTTDTGATNVVAAVYLGYRAYDTMGETMALFTAAMGVLLLMKKKRKVE